MFERERFVLTKLLIEDPDFSLVGSTILLLLLFFLSSVGQREESLLRSMVLHFHVYYKALCLVMRKVLLKHFCFLHWSLESF